MLQLVRDLQQEREEGLCELNNQIVEKEECRSAKRKQRSARDCIRALGTIIPPLELSITFLLIH